MGGKKLYATGSANRFTSKAIIPKVMPKAISRQPRTMRSRLIRKNLNERAFLIDRIPSQRLSTNPIIASTIAAWTAAWISKDTESKSKGRFTVIQWVQLLPGCITNQCLQFPLELDLHRKEDLPQKVYRSRSNRQVLRSLLKMKRRSIAVH